MAHRLAAPAAPFRPLLASLLTLLLLAGSAAGRCAPEGGSVSAGTSPVSQAPPCHGAAADREGRAAPTDEGRENAPSAPLPTCLRCPLCATVVPAPLRPAVLGAVAVPVAFAPVRPRAPEAPLAESPTPPPQA